MRREANCFEGATSVRRKALVICTHLRPGRTKRRSQHYLQPITGLHIASLMDQRLFDVRLHHEDWHGPYDTHSSERYDLVILTGLQADFDRMRQLSYHFRKLGAVVVAGGSICTLFPEFAAEFFDAVCAGGVDSVREVVDDFLAGAVKPIYRSPQSRIADYRVDYSLLARNAISPQSHLIEASRGCSFRCKFCVIPAEGAGHASYSLAAVAAAIDSAIASSPVFSFRHWYPTVLFVDNNFSDDRKAMLAIAELMRSHPRVRAWGALVTQDALHDRELIKRLSATKCRALFIGLESLDRELLRQFNKKQNLSRRGNVIDDIRFAESQGICIAYGYLFDPRYHTVAQMRAQIAFFAAAGLPLPTFYSLILPLAGTASFWEDVKNGDLCPNLRLRDLDGETIAYARLADDEADVRNFVEAFSRRPWTLVSQRQALLSTLRRIANARTLNPVQWYVIGASNFRTFLWSRGYPSSRRSYSAGENVLDPQYSEYPADIAPEDWKKYFEPIRLTDERGQLAGWLEPYAPKQIHARRQPASDLSIRTS
jgi:radical SAM superfamily enzyme YgiQ (UPF0313 family)